MATDAPFLFPCKSCGAHQFLIQGVCARCAPDLHRGWLAALAAFGEDEARYHAATGRRPLEDFDAFEAWLAENPAPAPTSADEGSTP